MEMIMKNELIIGTRGSKLALWQAEWIKSQLEKIHPGLHVSLTKIKTTGDKILDVPLAMVGGKGLFVKEIEEAMLRKEVDIAVHSMKDVPTEFPEGLHLAVICKREDPRDAFISRKEDGQWTIEKFTDLPQGAVVGTSSLRRSCQLLNRRPDITIEQLRGNVDTRLRKLDEGQFDAIILATAGVKRLGWSDRIAEMISPAVSLPAIGQGAVGIECRIGDTDVYELIKPLNHEETEIAVRAERAFLRKLEGGCQVPIACYATITDGTVIIDGLVGDVKGETIIKGHIEGPVEKYRFLGTSLAEDLLSRGAKEILEEVYGQGSEPLNGDIAS